MRCADDINRFCLLFFVMSAVSCNGQTGKTNTAVEPAAVSQVVGGGCDGCEIMYVDMPGVIDAVDTSMGWHEKGQHLLLTGKVFKKDEITPAPGVIVYYWHTDNNGYYSPAEGMTEKARRHGHIRGWVKTDAGGNYSIYTIKPAAYPGRDIPAHIHISLKEPGINEYYIDELVFEDDPLLTDQKRKRLENRGGSGILKTGKQEDLLIAGHNIILGLNIPGYPGKNK